MYATKYIQPGMFKECYRYISGATFPIKGALMDLQKGPSSQWLLLLAALQLLSGSCS